MSERDPSKNKEKTKIVGFYLGDDTEGFLRASSAVLHQSLSEVVRDALAIYKESPEIKEAEPDIQTLIRIRGKYQPPKQRKPRGA